MIKRFVVVFIVTDIICAAIRRYNKKKQMPDNFLYPQYYTISHFLSYSFFSSNVLYNCHFCQSVKEIPALNSSDEKRQYLDNWT